jgi:4-hydroxybenzoate polyprenyltransferase
MANRWWIYQRERFPLVAHGILIAVFSLSAISYSALLRTGSARVGPLAMVVAFLTAFLFFWQLRVLDEFKDYEEDVTYRSYRPVPRGVVTLRELGWLGLVAGLVQLALAWWLHPPLAALLIVAWLFLALMRAEFFVPGWLRSRPLVYMGSHMVIVPLIALYAAACDWFVAEPGPPRGLGWFLLAAFFNGIVVELGRKIRAPEDEEPGVPTYSVAWGVATAVSVWLLALGAGVVCALLAASLVAFTGAAALVLTPSVAIAVGAAWAFVHRPHKAGAHRIEIVSGIWCLVTYLILGPAQLVLRP